LILGPLLELELELLEDPEFYPDPLIPLEPKLEPEALIPLEPKPLIPLGPKLELESNIPLELPDPKLELGIELAVEIELEKAFEIESSIDLLPDSLDKE
jgi:hypothetical protein